MPSDQASSTQAANKNYQRLALLLAALAMLGPFSIDAYLPAFESIQTSLHVNMYDVQLTLTVYMLAFSFMMLWHGAVSDSVGRRNVILVSLLIYAMASLGCALAQTLNALLAFRILQGLCAGAGIVVGRAMIRDLYSGADAQRLLSLVTMIFSIAPAIAPIIGGYVVTFFNWRVIFFALLAYTALLYWACIRFLPESHPPELRHDFNAKTLFHNYKTVFSSSAFYFQAGAVALNFGGLFLYVAAAPVFLVKHLGLTAQQYGWQFVPMVGGMFLGALCANRMAGKVGIINQGRLGYFFLTGFAAINVIYHSIWPAMLPWSVIPIFFYAMGMSIVVPVISIMTLDLFPKIRGAAASCQSAAVMFAGALAAGLMAPLLDSSPLYLALGQLGISCGALLCWRVSIQRYKLNPSESILR